jgi:hypothetical protein
MPQPNDLSRSLVALDQDSTIIVVVEMSQSSWLVAGMLPGIERQPRKKLEPSAERLLGLLHRWRDEAVKAGRGRRCCEPLSPARCFRAGCRTASCNGPARRVDTERTRRLKRGGELDPPHRWCQFQSNARRVILSLCPGSDRDHRPRFTSPDRLPWVIRSSTTSCSPLLKLFLSRTDDLIARVSKKPAGPGVLSVAGRPDGD